MRRLKTIIEKNKITEQLEHRLSIALDETMLFFVVNFMDGRFIIEKSFKNNHMGVEQVKKMANKFDTEEKVMQYLGISEGDL